MLTQRRRGFGGRSGRERAGLLRRDGAVGAVGDSARRLPAQSDSVALRRAELHSGDGIAQRSRPRQCGLTSQLIQRCHCQPQRPNLQPVDSEADASVCDTIPAGYLDGRLVPGGRVRLPCPEEFRFVFTRHRYPGFG